MCPVWVGSTAAMAGRSTPSIAPSTILLATRTAPVLPALTRPRALPSFTRRQATRIELSFFFRRASDGGSSMSTVSEACTISMSFGEAPTRASSRTRSGSRPTRIGCRPSSRTAWTAPSTMFAGAKSPPIASTAILTGSRSKDSRASGSRSEPTARPRPGGCRLSRTDHASAFGDGDDRAALVVAAMRARPMRQPVLVAIRALRQAGIRQRVVTAPLVAPLLGVPTLGIGHRWVSFAAIGAAEMRLRCGSEDPHVGLGGAAAGAAVEVLAASRAKPPALLTADGLERKLQVRLLARHGREIHLAVRVRVQVAVPRLDLGLPGLRTLRPHEEQMKWERERMLEALETADAPERHAAGQRRVQLVSAPDPGQGAR